jgi:hypothetical protein
MKHLVKGHIICFSGINPNKDRYSGAKVILVGYKNVKNDAPVEVLRTISDSKELMQ